MAFWNRKKPSARKAVAGDLGINALHRVAPTVSLPPAPRPPYHAQRTWPAAEASNLLADWAWSGGSTNLQLAHQWLETLRSRARVEMRKNDYAQRYRQLLQTNVVGPRGFQLRFNFCGRTNREERDTPACIAFQRHFERWAREPAFCDVRGKSDLWTQLTMAVGQLPTDGEFILRRHRAGPFGFQLQAIDPQLLDVQYNDELPNGNRVRLGIELSPAGRAIAYWFNKPTDFAHYRTSERERVPANQVYHCFLQTLGPDQYRGIPWLATPMYRMHMLDGFEEAALVNARAGAAKMAFRRRTETSGYTGKTDGAGNRVSETAPGTIEDIGTDEIATFDPTFPAATSEEFHAQMMRGTSAGMGISFPQVSNNMKGVNFNTLRQNGLADQDYWRMVQQFIVADCLRQLSIDWLDENLIRGIPIPRRSGGHRDANVLRRDEYVDGINWHGRSWEWVDPEKMWKAWQLALQLGLYTRAEIIQITGRDPDVVMPAVEKEREKHGAVQPLPNAGNDAGDDDATDDDDDTAED